MPSFYIVDYTAFACYQYLYIQRNMTPMYNGQSKKGKPNTTFKHTLLVDTGFTSIRELRTTIEKLALKPIKPTTFL